MLTYGFYNALNNDRRYNATDISNLFDSLINDGVFINIGEAFAVSSSGGMNVNVGKGRAWFSHTWTNNDSEFPITIDVSDLVLDRIDIIVLEVDSSLEVRANNIKVIKGTASSIPTQPEPIRSETINQYPLCSILIKAGVTEITQADIRNMVGTESCPLVTGILNTINIETLLTQWNSQVDQMILKYNLDFQILFDDTTTDINGSEAQWESQFNTWFQGLQDMLDGNAETNILNEIQNLKGGMTWGRILNGM
jgi:hypothetical protein